MRILPNIQILKNGYRYLNIFLGKERKTNRFFAIIFKQRHHLVESKASMTYIRSIMREKLCQNVQIFSKFTNFENGHRYLNIFPSKERKTHGFLAFLFK